MQHECAIAAVVVVVQVGTTETGCFYLYGYFAFCQNWLWTRLEAEVLCAVEDKSLYLRCSVSHPGGGSCFLGFESHCNLALFLVALHGNLVLRWTYRVLISGIAIGTARCMSPDVFQDQRIRIYLSRARCSSSIPTKSRSSIK